MTFIISCSTTPVMLSGGTELDAKEAKKPLQISLDESELVEFKDSLSDAEKKDFEQEVRVTQYGVADNIPEDDDNEDVSEKDTAPGMHLRYKERHYKFWLKYFTTKEKNKKRFERHLDNGQKYKSIVTKILKEHGLPTDLFYVALIESGFNTHIKSHASAVGPWQFIKGTADRYGLKVNRYLDERRNIHKATHAAAGYFKDLYNIFGSWELALCAYNAGEYRIINAIRRGNTRDYRELVKKKLIPKETIYYIPKVVAAKHLSQTKYKDIDDSGWDKVHAEAKVERVRRSFKVSKMIKKLGVAKSLFKKLNPDIKNNYVRISRRQKYNIVIPNDVKLSKSLKSSLKKYTRKIASKYPTKANSGKTIYYKVRRGDNLTKIARKFGVSIRKIKANNRIRRSKIYIGQRLRISSSRSKTYVVKRGDNLYKIAKRFGTSIKKIVAANSLKRKMIFPNQKITIPIKG